MIVTCCIPCRNAVDTIERAITSAIEAGVDAVYVYDDASTDGSFERLSELIHVYPVLSMCYGSRVVKAGVNFARNFLIENAMDGLIIPLDADDTLRPIAPLVTAWEPGTWVYGDNAEHDGGTVTNIRGAAVGALPRKNVTGVTFLFHRSDWLKVGGYDSDFAYAEDYAFQCALANAGVQGHYIDTVVYDRYIKPQGNERTALAGHYWDFYRNMARRKYPKVFNNMG